jgi:hypothetical protein
MTQASTQQNADETIDEQRVEEFVLDFLLLIEALYDEVSECQANQPTQSVPAERAKASIRIPSDIS